jgi:hypothetical protein
MYCSCLPVVTNMMSILETVFVHFYPLKNQWDCHIASHNNGGGEEIEFFYRRSKG